jgi:DNA gyrase subunit B
MIAYRKLLQQVTRRGHPGDIVDGLLRADARDRSFFEQRAGLDTIAARMTTPLRAVTVTRDDEHNVFELDIEDRSQGFPRRTTMGLEFVTSGEYRTLLNAFREIQDVRFPVVVRMSDAPAEEEPTEDSPAAAEPARDQAEGAARPARGRKEQEVTVGSVDDFVDFFIGAGKKGVAINRYKGLGEMNPETLWTTTMDPENRTLLQVRAEDHAEADSMFTTLMGDQVEPRRKFIEDNALDVRNLDV